MRRDQPRVLVVGGTGLIGAAVVDRFVSTGHDVTVLARRTGIDLPGLTYLRGDVADATVVRRAAAGVDHVVLAAGGGSPADAELGRVGAGEAHLAENLAQLPEVGLTYLSSGGCVYGEDRGRPAREDDLCFPVSAYGRDKLAGEAAVLQASGVSARVLRVANVYGPGQRVGGGQGLVAALLDAVRTGRPVTVFGDMTMTRDYVHADDVAVAVVGLCASPPQPAVLNVGTGVGSSVAEVIAAVALVTGTQPHVVIGPGRPFDVHRNVLDAGRLMSSVSWSPVPLLEGIESTWRSGLELSDVPVA